MDEEKLLIWTNDQTARDDEEDFVKDEWINEVRAQLGLCDSNDTWVPDDLVSDVKEAAIDAAVNEAVGNHETTIDFMEAYRSYARPEQIEKHIEEDYADQLDAVVKEHVNDWLGDEQRNLSGIDTHKFTVLIDTPGDGYTFMDQYSGRNSVGPMNNAGELIKELRKLMDGETVKLSVKNGELTVSESVGYVGEMEDHTVKLVEKDFVNALEDLTGDELDDLLGGEGFAPGTTFEDMVVVLAERDDKTFDVASAIGEVYGWESSEERNACESLDEMMSAKSEEASLGGDDVREAAPENGER